MEDQSKRENSNSTDSETVSNEAVKRDAKSLWQNSRVFLSELLDIRQDTDRDSTIEAVKKDISFKGHNAWILIFAIFVASIGLNVGSTAVIIGAMLISPLMGPIVGAGLSLAINDVEMLRRSMINLAVMVSLSVLTAFIYFLLIPLKADNSELLGRTYPTILDVLVAIFGGLALIVAKTKKGTIASVIFGVAIATALMPPLCTVGYGLAIGNGAYATGALYLFSINAVFIALSTFVVSKLLGFPMVKYANSRRRRFISQMASAIGIIVMVPSMFLFYNLYKEQVFKNEATNFVEENIQHDGTSILSPNIDYKDKKVELFLIGNLVSKSTIAKWEKEFSENPKLAVAELRINQGADQSTAMAEELSNQVKTGILEDLYANNQQAIADKNQQILLLENELNRLKSAALPFQSLSEEVHVNYEDIERFGFSNTINTNFEKADTIPTFMIEWKPSLSEVQKRKEEQKLKAWLKLKYKLDTLAISRY
ncbi:MAG: hypothetical protein CMF34_13565 [Leeuwenhoekiella sp.]|uniref:DUF389 domain-containing protein n=1 Tax=unclassified Leeuwenhoekiella TaxID=2615029 RepID=UPI000C580212|nr:MULTISPECIES: DUF389 domain-containing protein [unclassified Leeuwenhoekiella]MAS21260.1 hypothetical protein [Leeuwenhoekiella sp.]MAW93900.1 hypothetical protein [Leeuwenhoekiella sp.]MBA81686.1 hypothetical protein [Leeuwenhoekiella sp.]|tara:strand:+ start:31938 stop:33383 length:1446 start_codon:yes stop_codon:yes gene_type:complete